MSNIKIIYAAREDRRMTQETQQQNQLEAAIRSAGKRVWVEDASGGRWEEKGDDE